MPAKKTKKTAPTVEVTNPVASTLSARDLHGPQAPNVLGASNVVTRVQTPRSRRLVPSDRVQIVGKTPNPYVED